MKDENDKRRAGELPADPKAGTKPMNQRARDRQPAVQRYGLMSIQQLMSLARDEIKKRPSQRGAPTGFRDIDDAIGGYRRGNITVLGAKRSFGKTSFSIKSVDACSEDGYGVLLFSGEDPAIMYGKRWLSRRTGLSAVKIRDNELTERDLAAAVDPIAHAPKNPMFIRVKGRPVEWICKAIQDLKNEMDIALVVVDYLQKIKTSERTQDRRNHVSVVTAKLVDAIRDADAAGLLLSQLKRGSDGKPDIEDLKESGDIEDMADHVLLGWKHDGKRSIVFAKNKDGMDPDGLMDVDLEFNDKTASFVGDNKEQRRMQAAQKPAHWAEEAYQ